MPFTIKLDEDLPLCLRDLLVSRGYDAVTIWEQQWAGLKDPLLWPRIAAEGRFFITADKEFGDVRKFPPGTHPGILLLRAGRQSGAVYHSLVVNILDSYRLETLAGCVAVAGFGRVRIRHAPTDESR